MITNNKKSATVMGIFSILLKTFTSFFLTPLMITTFGKGDYGVYKIVVATTAYFMLLDMGMHTSIIRFISKHRVNNDIGAQNKYLGLMQLFYFAVVAIIIVAGIVFYQFIPSVFGKSLTAEEIRLFSKLFTISICNSAIIMVFNAYPGILIAHERFVFSKTMQLLVTVFKCFIMYILLLNDCSVISIVVLDVAVNFVNGLVYVLYVRHMLKLKPAYRQSKLSDMKEVFAFSGFVFINMVAFQIFWSTDNIILGIMTSSTMVAIYSAGTTINAYFQTFAGVFSEFLMPSAVRMVEGKKSNRDELALEMARIGRFIFLFLGLIIVVFTFAGDKFIVLWLGEDFRPAYFIALIVMVPQLLHYAQQFGPSIMWAKNKHKYRSLVMLLVALLNAMLTIFLIKVMGMLGAAVGTTISYIVGYLLFTTWYYHKHVGINMILFFKKLQKRILVAYLPILPISYIIRIAFQNMSWKIFLLQCILLTINYCAFIVVIGMNTDEKALMKNMVCKVLKLKGREKK